MNDIARICKFEDEESENEVLMRPNPKMPYCTGDLDIQSQRKSRFDPEILCIVLFINNETEC